MNLTFKKLESGIAEWACEDVTHLLKEIVASEHHLVLEVGVNRSLGTDHWRRETIFSAAGYRVRLEGGSEQAISTALYALLERLGWQFEIYGTIHPVQLQWDRLPPGVEECHAALHRRGIRQHINFPMDISSYPLEEAREYIRNLARMGFNHITFHSYTGQWFEVELPDRQVLAGGFFYGWRHELPDDPLVRKHVRNRRVFCIPDIEAKFDQPEERSRLAMAWLREVMREAKRVGLYVQFSFEPLSFPKMSDALAACDAIVAAYPEIDRLELITNETGGWGTDDTEDKILTAAREAFGEAMVQDPALHRCMDESRRGLASYLRDLGHVMAVLRELPRHWAGRSAPALSCGIYCAVPAFLRLSLPLMRQGVPSDMEFAILASHGSRGVVHNLREADLTDEDWHRTLLYSWIEFDGLMFMQQNPVRGIRQLFEETEAVAGLGNIRGMAFNHWRTAENATCARYAAEASIKGPLAEIPFYRERAAFFGIGNPRRYAAGMMEIDDADGRATLEVPNVGFCAGWGGDTIGILRWQLFDNAQRVEEQYEHARQLLLGCAESGVSASGKQHLALLDNRLRCTVSYLQAVKRAAALTPLCFNRDPGSLSVEERRQVVSICDEAIIRLQAYKQTFVALLPDRGAEGLLVSFCKNLPSHLAVLRKRYGETMAAKSVNESTTEGPPLPIVA